MMSRSGSSGTRMLAARADVRGYRVLSFRNSMQLSSPVASAGRCASRRVSAAFW